MPVEPDDLERRCRDVLDASFTWRLGDPDKPAACFLSALHYFCGHTNMQGVAGPADGDPPMDEFDLWVALQGLREVRPAHVPRAQIPPLPASAARDFIRLIQALASQRHGAWMLGGKREFVNTVTIVDSKVTRTSVYFKLRVT